MADLWPYTPRCCHWEHQNVDDGRYRVALLCRERRLGDGLRLAQDAPQAIAQAQLNNSHRRR